jgi:hypothetical protein
MARVEVDSLIKIGVFVEAWAVVQDPLKPARKQYQIALKKQLDHLWKNWPIM